ncbi:hypothetical protein IFT73_15350 [Aeromicrobium sp. CFBP 8757]|uniref:hypothetical protein n=1 Tax=Aeromicrobium sp. CFBP 8757 TaxID=2775288 RepID=UPI001786867C|nr:hypothetical protein [Aeromicrobium sp. CFBP 8757]MBD8608234.1 hypothetical protein [Aeromicrobium sp. CFBP 8757]
MRTSARVAATLLTTTVVIGGTATVASAQSTTLRDKSADVISFADQTTDERGTQLGYSDSVASGVDLRSMRVKHTKKSITVTLRFAELSGETTPIASLRLDGASKASRYLLISGDDRAAVVDTKGRKRCNASVTARLGAKGYVKFTAKRSCLKNPRRIKVAGFAADAGYQAGDDTPFKADSVSPKSVRGDAWTKWLKAS